MKNIHKGLLALGMASVTLSTTPLLADPPPGGYGSMMGGYHMMPGMMPGYRQGAGAVELSDEQRAKMRDIQRSMFKENMGLQEKLMDEYARLDDFYAADKPDPEAVQEAYDRINALRKQMVEKHLQARNRMYDLLTDEQKKMWRSQRRQWGHMGMMGPGYGYGPMGPGMMAPGYGYGPMGPGMMGPGWGGYGPMGPGMMGPGYGPWWED
ncbi:MAG: Spy/CpxP family protein refolding chaperone [Pseudomonadota bacterium]